MWIDRLKSMKKKLMIFGSGLDSVRCSYKLEKAGIDYEGYVVSKPEKEIFRTKKVFAYDTLISTDAFIIVATSYESYPSVSRMLRNSGKKEFVDYIYYEYLDRKIVFLHGNCHMNVIEKYLNSSYDFRKEYVFYHAPRLTSGCEPRSEQEIFQNIDLWIHQDIRVNNAIGYKVSDEYIRSQIDTNSVKEIVVPNLYGMGKGFFPQNGNETNNSRNEPITNCIGIDYNGMFCVPDLVIRRCLECGMKVDEIVRHCNRYDLFEKNDVLKLFESMLCKIENREHNWDVKIKNYILENYKTMKLFYDAYHPTNAILEYISKEILKILNIEIGELYCECTLDTHEEPVYPAVKRILGLEWEENEIRKSDRSKKCISKMNFDEYVREYVWWCYVDRN